MGLTIKQNITAVNKFIGRFGHDVKGVVIHSMAGTYSGSISWFHNPDAKASAHYNIRSDGEITMTVEEKDGAWHSGNVTAKQNKAPRIVQDMWGVNPNFYTIGVELEDKKEGKKRVYPQLQYMACVELVADICQRHNIKPTRDYIFMHKESDPINKNDPWGKWDHDQFVKDVAGLIKNGQTASQYDDKLFEHNDVLTISDWLGDYPLVVRSLPSTESPKVSTKVNGDTMTVVGFVRGQRVAYETSQYGNISTQFWWKTILGNYVWAGGTYPFIPSLDNYPEEVFRQSLLNSKKGDSMEELRNMLETLEARNNEISPAIAELKQEQSENDQEIARIREELAQAEAEATPAEETAEEPVAEEAPAEEAPAEEVVEEPATDAEKEEIMRLAEELRAKASELEARLN